MNSSYFPNATGYECFRSSLANLLVELKDPETASRVYKRFYDHPIAQTHHAGIATKLVDVLTKGIYEADLIWYYEGDLKVSTLKRFGGRIGQQIIEVMQDEIKKGRLKIMTGNGTITKKLPFMNTISYNNPDNLNHWIVQREDGKQINDGVVMSMDTNQFKINGTLELKRVR